MENHNQRKAVTVEDNKVTDRIIRDIEHGNITTYQERFILDPMGEKYRSIVFQHNDEVAREKIAHVIMEVISKVNTPVTFKMAFDDDLRNPEGYFDVGWRKYTYTLTIAKANQTWIYRWPMSKNLDIQLPPRPKTWKGKIKEIWKILTSN